MAFTEKYLSVAGAGAHDGSSAANAWTLAEFLTNNTAGDRGNMISGSYSSGADAFSNAGTISALSVLRGYNSTIGDLDTVGRDTPANGSGLITTNMPSITITGAITFSNFVLLMNLNVTGALATFLLGATVGPDNVFLYQCKVTNTLNNSGASCVRGDNNCAFIMCDFECTGAAHGPVVDADVDTVMIACRSKCVVTTSAHLQAVNATVLDSLFIDGGKALRVLGSTNANIMAGNTAYNCEKFIELPNAAQSVVPISYNNHPTDCAEFIDSLYSATAATAFLEMFNRTRDNTTARTGVGDGLLVGEVTTDTGDDTTDYTDASTDDFSLISGAPGEDAGLKIG